jgi:DNA-binding MarR family transcriptional regulator
VADANSDDTKSASTLIRLSKQDVQDARRLLSLLAGGGEAASPSPQKTYLDRAREILLRRRRREQIFGKGMFGEPAWDMLLLLYVSESGRRQTISRLAKFAGASKSTAIRWMDYLEGQKLISRETHPTDKRAVFVELSRRGRDAMELYLSDTAISSQ